MKESPKGGRGPPWDVAPLERETGDIRVPGMGAIWNVAKGTGLL